MPNTSQIADILFKKGLGLGTTQSGRAFFEEPIQGRVFVVPNQIWTEADSIPLTAPASTSGIVQKVDDYSLSQVVGTSNSFSGELLKDAIPFNWGDGTSYNYTVKDSTDASIAFGVNDWVIDTEAGILMFNNGIPSNMPPKVSFYRYSGAKGVGGGGAGDVVSINGVTGFIQLTGSGNVGIEVNGTTFSIGGSFVTPDQTGFLATKDEVSAAAAGVSSINSNSGILTFVGSNGISISTNAGTFTFSGSLDSILSLSGDLAATGGVFNQSGLSLWNRDLGLSQNIASLSGTVAFSSQTGSFLDSTDLTYLEGRDNNLSSNLASISGNLNVSGLNLFNRDVGLSNNIAALSGITLTASDTGLFLSQSDSGNFASKNETGQFASDTDLGATGQTLWLRDQNLSSNIASLSGSVVFQNQTGGFLDLADQTSLELRDTELGNNINTLSGVVNTNSSNISIQTNRITSLTGSLNATGSSLWTRDEGLSQGLIEMSGLIAAASAGVSAINNESGILTFVGANGISISNIGSAFTFSGSLDDILSLSGNVVASGGVFNTSGLTLWNRDLGLSSSIASLSGLVVFQSQTGGFLDLSDQTYLESRDLNLSSNVSSLSGAINNRVSSLSGSLNETGQNLFGRDVGLSSNIAALSGIVLTANDTGLFLTQSDSGNFVSKNETGQFASDIDISTLTSNLGSTGQTLWNRDSNLSSSLAALSGSVVFSNETGGFLDPTDTSYLEGRDSNLSSNVAILSGNVYTNFIQNSETGGFLDLSDRSVLEARDTELSNNIASLSGNVVFDSETGGFLDATDLSSLESRDTELSNNVATLSGDIVFKTQTGGLLDHASGKILWDRDIGLSDSLIALSGAVDAASAGVSSINGVSGIVTLVGAKGVDISNVGSTFTFSGSQDVIDSLTGNLIQTGAILWNRDSELSANLALVSGQGGWDHASGALLWNRDSSLSGSLDETGAFLFNRANQTGEIFTSDVLSTITSWATASNLNTNDFNGYTILLSAGTDQTGVFPQNVKNGYSIVFANINDGAWTFSGDGTLRDLDDNSLTGYTLFKGDTILVQYESGTNWRLFGKNSETGGFLDLADQTALESRDSELSLAIVGVSGNITNQSNRITSLSGSLNSSGSLLWSRDAVLSANIAALSGAAVLDAETGIFLSQGDSGNIITRLGSTGQTLWTRDAALSSNVATLSGTVVTQTNRITSLTGSLNSTGLSLFNRDLQLSNNVASISGNLGATGQTLWNRDAGLSASIADLSGTIPAAINTGGFLDHASGKILWDRDAGLVDSIVDLSGSAVFSSQTGDFLDPTDTAYLEGRDTELGSNVASLSGNVVFKSETGGYLDLADQTALELRDTNLSSNVALISGNLVASGGTFNQTGLDLFNRDIGLSSSIASVSGLIPTLPDTGGLLDIADRTELEARDTELSSNVATLSGNVNTNTTNLSNLTSRFENDITGVKSLDSLTGHITFADAGSVTITQNGQTITISGQVGSGDLTAAIFSTVLLSGVQTQWIQFPENSTTAPVVNITIENTGSEYDLPSYGISGLTTSGYWLNTSFPINSSGYRVHTYTNLTNVDLITDASGLLLWNRDIGLSDSIAAVSGLIGGGDVTQAVVDSLSGNLVATGGVFNTTGLNLWNRDLGLSANIAALSGASALASQTGTFITQGDSGNIVSRLGSTGQTLWLRDNGLSTNLVALSGSVTLQTNRVTSLSGSMNSTGLSLFNRDVGLSSAIATRSGNLNTTGQTLWIRDTALSSNVATLSGTVNTQTNRVTSLSGSMNSTGLNLFNRDLGLSSNIATLSGTVSTNSTNISLQTNRVTSLSGSLDTTGLSLWNRDLELSNNLAAVSGLAGGGFPDSSGFYLRNRSNHTGTQQSETVFQSIDYWTTPETLTNAYNSRYTILSAAGPSYTALPDNLSGGMTAHFANVNIGEWVFTGSNLRNLNDENLTGYALNKGEMVTFILESGAGFGSTYWRALASNETGFYLSNDSGILLWNRDDSLSGSLVGLSDEVALVSGLAVGGGLPEASGTLLWNRDASLSGSMDETGLNLWNRDLELSSNLALVSGQGGWDHASGTLLWNRDLSLSGSLDETGALLFNRANQTGNISSENVFAAIDLWTSAETLNNNYNGRNIILSAGSLTSGQLPNGLAEGFSIGVANVNIGDWTFSALSSLRNLNDDALTGYAVHRGEYAVFTLESGDNWRVYANNSEFVLTSSTGGFLDLYDKTSLESRDTALSSNVSSLSGAVVSLTGSLDETGALLFNRANQTGEILTSDILTNISLWSSALNINEADLNGYNIILSAGTDQTGFLPLDIKSGYTIGFTNINVGDWTFSGSALRNLNDDLITGFTIYQGDYALFQFESGTNWRVFDNNKTYVLSAETGDLLDLADKTALELRDTNLSSNVSALSGNLNSSGLSLFNRDLQLSNNVSSVSGLIGLQTNRVTSLSGSMDQTGLDLWNRDLELSNNLASVSGNVVFTSETGGFLDHASGKVLWERDLVSTYSMSGMSAQTKYIPLLTITDDNVLTRAWVSGNIGSRIKSPNNSAVFMDLSIFAFQSGGSNESKAFNRKYIFKNMGSLVSVSSGVIEDIGSPNWMVYLQPFNYPSGDDFIDIKVSGENSKTIVWKGTAKIEQIF